jgi:hypothetical protein
MSDEDLISLEEYIDLARKAYEANSAAFYRKYSSIMSGSLDSIPPGEQAKILDGAISTATISVSHLVQLRRMGHEYLDILESMDIDMGQPCLDVELMNNVLDDESRDIRAKKGELVGLRHNLYLGDVRKGGDLG